MNSSTPRGSAIPGAWTCRHIKLSNPAGPGRQDVPRLLRATAEMLERIGDMQVLDIVLEEDQHPEGPWTALNIYFQTCDSQPR